MRRLVVSLVALLALAVPAAASALHKGPADGSLVVRNGDNGDGVSGRAVATVIVEGFAIGRVSDLGRITIYDLDASDANAPEVTGASWHKDVSYPVKGGDRISGTQWGGTNMRFRAVDGTFKLVIQGSGVYLFASGHGSASLTGSADTPRSDGQFSLNGGDWRSIPLDADLKIGAGPVG